MEAAKKKRGRGAGIKLAGEPSAARQKMWAAMRILRRFGIGELLQVAEIARRKTAEKYLTSLARAGYLRVEERARGCDGSVYVLIRNTGPFAPRVGRKGLTLDPNIEIAQLRDLRAQCAAQIVACDERLARLGAFVERQNLGSKSVR